MPLCILIEIAKGGRGSASIAILHGVLTGRCPSQAESMSARDEVERLGQSLKVTEDELAQARTEVQRMLSETHEAHRSVKEAEMLEAQARKQHEMDMVRIADINQ